MRFIEDPVEGVFWLIIDARSKEFAKKRNPYSSSRFEESRLIRIKEFELNSTQNRRRGGMKYARSKAESS